MTFLTPGAGLLAAGVGLPVLLALYLLKLRRRSVRVTSTMLWEQAANDLQVNVPLRWLRSSWMLLLHALILLLFAFAIARPVTTVEGVVSDRVVIVLDASASMNARTSDDASRLDAVKADAADFARSLAARPDPPAVGVVVVTGGARTALPMTPLSGGGLGASPGLRAVLDAIEAITPTDIAGTPEAVAEALLIAEETAGVGRGSSTTQEVVADDSNGFGPRPPAAIVVYSDHAAIPNPGGVTATSPGTLRPETRPSGAAVVWRGSGSAADPDAWNAGVVAMSASRDFDDPSLVRVFARVMTTRRGVLDIPVAIEVDGEALGVEAVAVSAARTDAGDALAGGLSRSIRLPGRGIVTVRTPAGGAYAGDDSASFVTESGRAPAVLLVGDDPTGSGRPTIDPFLADVFGVLDTSLITSITAARYDGAPAADLARYDVVVLDRVTTTRGIVRPTLSFFSRFASDGDAGVRTFAPAITPGTWDRDHPTLRNAPLDTLLVTRALPWWDGEAIAETADGVPLISDVRAGEAYGVMELERSQPARRDAAHIAVHFPLDSSNWPLQVSFPIFLVESMDALIAAGRPGNAGVVRTGAAASVRLGRPNAAARLEPISVSEGVVGGGVLEATADAAGVVRFGEVDRAGVYAASAGGGTELPVATAVLSKRETVEAGIAPVLVGVGDPDNADDSVGDGATAITAERELWPWFVVAATALLLAEWVIYAFKMRA